MPASWSRDNGRVTNATPRVLVSVSSLAASLAAGEPVHLLDVRWSLAVPDGRDAYRAGHLPGAVYVSLDTELSRHGAPEEGRHPLPDVSALQDAARRWGLRSGERVVVYDDGPGLAAARAWWLLRWAGVEDVVLLDGGLAAWQVAGGALEAGDAVVGPGDVTLTGGHLPTADDDDAAAWPARGVLLDARAGERYRGETEPVDPRAGHVPGAVSAPTIENLAADGRFLPRDQLAARFAALGVTGGSPVAVYCGSGVTAAHEIAALALVGVPAALYPGSWSAWSNQPDRPAATGPTP
ncbi:MAG: sulfurtransferase [Actinomycetales bacterium]|nr:sulfurtransferase [Actinomycetales bacterium]